MTAAKLRTAQAAMGQPETHVGALCRELGVTRQTLYRHVGPKGELRPDKRNPWDLANLTPYREEYLSGFQSEMYQVELEQGFERARERMAPVIRRDVEQDIGGDHQRINALDTRYGEIRFKHVLLPVWISAFRFRDKTYRFVVNGRTGEVQGERPYSAWKIALAILLAALLIGGSLAAWQHFSAAKHGPVLDSKLRYDWMFGEKDHLKSITWVESLIRVSRHG